MNNIYLCIDLKSFYASVECVERNLDPLTTNLIVADSSRTNKTICLAVTPSLKQLGVSSRPRLFEVEKTIKDINKERKKKIKYKDFSKKSFYINEILTDPFTEVDYLIAPPRMAHYIKYSAKIYSVYLKYIAPEDIHIYSIDEVFIDITKYLKMYNKTPHDLAMMIIKDVLKETKITATVGIGTNMYLAKVAMDIVAKKMPPDEDGVRVAELNEMSYRYKLWDHTPLTDFWRVGKGISNKLNFLGLYTMGDVARCSLEDEDILYKIFGINAELLIDHAWGFENCTMNHVKNYSPVGRSVGTGQVLHCSYEFDKARLILKEMADSLSMDLLDKKLLTKQLVITIGYDFENLNNPLIANKYNGEITEDYLGRTIPKHAHGTINLKDYTCSTEQIVNGCVDKFNEIVDPDLLIRRVNISATHIINEQMYMRKNEYEQLDLFTNYEEVDKIRKQESKKAEKEKRAQQAMLNIKKKYGKNAVIKGMNLEEGATMKDRNNQIGGHRA